MLIKKSLCGALALIMGCSMMIPLGACAKNNGGKESSGGDELPTFSVSEFRSSLRLVSESVFSYMEAVPEAYVTNFLDGSAVNRTDRGKPISISYTWDNDASPAVASANVEFSLKEDFSVIDRTERIEEGKSSCAVYNLQTGAQYYFRVNVTLESGDIVTNSGSFETEASPRMLYLDGGNNARDIGGWKTESGKVVKQGLLYRGGEIDGGKNKGHQDFCLTETGLAQLRALGIKTDFDLRSPDVAVTKNSVLGEDVERTFYNAFQYQSALSEDAAPTTKRIFSDLAKPEKYPVYLHCTHGVDRAGTTVLLLEALLGVSKDDVIRDYELSAFYHNYAHVYRYFDNGGTIMRLLEELEKFEGETLADKTEAFMLSIGVTADEIASIRNIFLG